MKNKIAGAVAAWGFAIQSFIDIDTPGDESIADRAKDYGRYITDQESLDVVSGWFNWDEITKALTGKP